MIAQPLNSKNQIPFHIHKGQNILRVTAIILLTALISFSIYSIKSVGFIMIMLLLASVFGLICIRFPKIYLYDDRFEILKKCLIDKFTDCEVFKYDEINEIEFSEGFTNWNNVILLTILGSGDFTGNSKADQMILNTKDNNSYVFNRFGNQSDFIETIELINRKIKTGTNYKSSRTASPREG